MTVTSKIKLMITRFDIAVLRAELRHAQALSHSYLGQFQDANAAKMELARQLAEACKARDEALRKRARQTANTIQMKIRANLMSDVLTVIAELGAASRNGTARKQARMAQEALE